MFEEPDRPLEGFKKTYMKVFFSVSDPDPH
jgi:hypothetical protein